MDADRRKVPNRSSLNKRSDETPQFGLSEAHLTLSAGTGRFRCAGGPRKVSHWDQQGDARGVGASSHSYSDVVQAKRNICAAP